MRSIFLSATALAVAMVAVPAACLADYAMVLTSSLCSNQYDAMNVIWARGHYEGLGAQKLFYFDGTSFTPIGHTSSFDTLSQVVISAHGIPGEIEGGGTADTFATAFKGAHPSTPASVTLLTCYSAKVSGGKSVMGALAGKYPSDATTSGTGIANLYGSKYCSGLRKPAIGLAATIPDAIYVDALEISQDGQKIVGKLSASWKNDKYEGLGGQKQTFAKYCDAVIGNVADIPDFVAAVNNQYGIEYLQLINYNGGGVPQTRCGADWVATVCH